MKKILFLLSFLIFGLASRSQTMEVGLFGGFSYYLGDLNPGYHFLSPRLAYGALARINFNPRLAMKVNVYRGKVTGDDYKSNTNEIRGLNFESPVTDVSIVGEFNFFEYFTGSKRDKLTPYIFGGVGVFWFKPSSGGTDLRDAGTEGQNVGFDGRKPYKLYNFSIPFGFGIKYSLNSRFALTAEWGLRKTFSDYIDDVSTTYYLTGDQIDPNNPELVLSDPTFAHDPYMERGNPKTRDWYCFTGLTLTYKFKLFGRRGCPDQQRSVPN